jgi:hypothetical protein
VGRGTRDDAQCGRRTSPLLRRAEVNEPWEADVVVEEPESESNLSEAKKVF